MELSEQNKIMNLMAQKDGYSLIQKYIKTS